MVSKSVNEVIYGVIKRPFCCSENTVPKLINGCRMAGG